MPFIAVSDHLVRKGSGMVVCRQMERGEAAHDVEMRGLVGRVLITCLSGQEPASRAGSKTPDRGISSTGSSKTPRILGLAQEGAILDRGPAGVALRSSSFHSSLSLLSLLSFAIVAAVAIRLLPLLPFLFREFLTPFSSPLRLGCPVYYPSKGGLWHPSERRLREPPGRRRRWHMRESASTSPKRSRAHLPADTASFPASHLLRTSCAATPVLSFAWPVKSTGRRTFG